MRIKRHHAYRCPETCVQTTLVFKLVRDLSNGAISNDLERTITLFSSQAIL